MKIDIIAGFLGAGKTTFINKLFAEGYAGKGTVLIENEFGDTNIDSELIEHEIQIVELTSGCICCTLRGDFIRGICEIYEKWKPERILIEPTGAAERKDILEACEKACTLIPGEINSVVTIVNAEAVIPLLEIGGDFFKEQLEQAEYILLSCVQNLSNEELEETIKYLESLALKAPIIRENWNQINAITVMAEAEYFYHLSKNSRSEYHGNQIALNHSFRWFPGKKGDIRSLCSHQSIFNVCTIYPDRIYINAHLVEVLETLIEYYPDSLFRMKGFLETEQGMMFVEYVYGMGLTFRKSNYEKKPILVLIGKNIDETYIKSMLLK